MKKSLFSLAVLFSLSASAMAAQVDTNGKLEISDDDYSFSARIIGLLQMDADFYGHASTADHELKNGAFIRRARIGVQGNVHEWEYKVEFDMASNAATLKSAYVRRLLGPGKFS